MEQFAAILASIVTALWLIAFFIIRVRDWQDRQARAELKVRDSDREIES